MTRRVKSIVVDIAAVKVALNVVLIIVLNIAKNVVINIAMNVVINIVLNMTSNVTLNATSKTTFSRALPVAAVMAGGIGEGSGDNVE